MGFSYKVLNAVRDSRREADQGGTCQQGPKPGNPDRTTANPAMSGSQKEK